tara:strand:- start:218 stop:934 length:717 start_codon:yes stop_codon:yes gene_type:complete
MNILIQFPTYARPDKFLKCLEKYLYMSSSIHHLHFNINCDEDDSLCNNSKFVGDVCGLFEEKENCTFSLKFDKNTNKISAINDHIDARFFDFDVVICASDDMIPQQQGWDDVIAKDMNEFFPKLNGALHYFDGYQKESLITLSILGRELYNHFGYIYHPDYKSLYCDNEFTQSVYNLGRVKYIDNLIIKHEHYGEEGNSNSGDFDASAQKTLRYAGRDQVVFERRKQLGFPKQRITND